MREPVRSGVTLALVLPVLLAACGAARAPAAGAPPATAQPSPASSTPGPPGNVRTTPLPLPILTPPTGDRVLVARDKDNGRTFALCVGDQLELVLASTYWEVDGSSNPGVLRELGQPAVSPSPGGCVPGEGCGTVTAIFDAVSGGQVTVSARRTTCGEAMSCAGSLGFYRITVVVAAG